MGGIPPGVPGGVLLGGALLGGALLGGALLGGVLLGGVLLGGALLGGVLLGGVLLGGALLGGVLLGGALLGGANTNVTSMHEPADTRVPGDGLWPRTMPSWLRRPHSVRFALPATASACAYVRPARGGTLVIAITSSEPLTGMPTTYPATSWDPGVASAGTVNVAWSWPPPRSWHWVCMGWRSQSSPQSVWLPAALGGAVTLAITVWPGFAGLGSNDMPSAALADGPGMRVDRAATAPARATSRDLCMRNLLAYESVTSYEALLGK